MSDSHRSGGGGSNVPAPRSLTRFVGIGPEGQKVDNVTKENRYNVYPKRPWLKVHIYDEDLTRIVRELYIPNTRERPDVIIFEGEVYGVVDTTLPVPRYREVMTLTAVTEPPTGEQHADYE